MVVQYVFFNFSVGILEDFRLEKQPASAMITKLGKNKIFQLAFIQEIDYIFFKFTRNYLRTFLWVLYSVPPQNGDSPAETKKYKMTPTLHISEAGEA